MRIELLEHRTLFSTDITGQHIASVMSLGSVVSPAAETSVAIRASADAYVRDGSYIDQNFGQATGLDIKKVSGAGYTREAYFRFSLTGVGSAASISSAKLRLYGVPVDSSPIRVGLFTVGGTTWSESGLTWTNKPATSASPLTTVAVNAARWYEFDVAGYVKQQKTAGATAVAFAFKTTSGTGMARFSSDEALNFPQLVVQQTPPSPPPPITQALVVSPLNLTVTEGSSASFAVRLAITPAADVIVNVTRAASGDESLSVNVQTLTFTPADWNTPQTVTVSAAADADLVDGSAQFIVSATDLPSRSVTAAEDDTTSPFISTLRAAADSYVRDGSYAGQNFGQATSMDVKAVPSIGYIRESYLRFELTQVGAPTNILDAKLRLYGAPVDSSAITIGLFTVASTTWAENSITWANKPSVGASPLATVAVNSARWYEFDVASYLKQQRAAGATAVAFAIRTTAGTGMARFSSDETNSFPQLVVQQAVAPVMLSGLTLINASTDTAIGSLTDGAVIDTSVFGSSLNIRAEAAPDVGSVVFNLDGQVHVETLPPRSYPGDIDGDYLPWTPTVGLHTLTVTPYPGPDGAGDAGIPIVVRFSVVRSPTALADKVADALTFAGQRLKLTLADLNNATTTYPRTTRPDGTWISESRSVWTSGFLPGALWQMYAMTDDAYWKDKATASTLGLQGNETLTEDTAFRVFVPFAPLFDATGGSSYRDLMLAAAAAKSSQFSETVGAFFTGWRASRSGNPAANFGVLIDQMMDLELQFWAAAQTGNTTCYDQAVRNARTVAQHLVRPDGGSYHWGYFDKDTGQFISGETAQGYANESTWARGQAWGIYAFTMCYRETGDVQFLETARKLADYFISHLPSDQVPFWDFSDPAIPDTYKDSSAAAIAASALFELATLDAVSGTTYRQSAEAILGALTSAPYLSTGASNRAILERGAWYIPQPVNSGSSGTIWGDYYLLEAINRYRAG